ncbi:MAG: cyclase family protein [Gammaproteobacteria bacterium]|nr:cyclase family protein [Gammaproteobacteria bacterium]MYH47161.1 cyclase family protein [Gammaproteobacteria bacterium]MYL12898.1 cyclase family protein [Gammaproteobacteria bacterium]
MSMSRIYSPAPFSYAAALLLVVSGAHIAAQEFQAHPSTQDPARLVTLEMLAEWEQELSNWGRWGPDDQRGTLNLITPEKTVQAASLVEIGETVTLQHFVLKERAMDSQSFGPYEHWMSRVDPETGEPTFALDEIQFSLHDGMLSHIDALCHYRTEIDGRYVIFNGYDQNLTVNGCEDLAVDRMGTSYVTRGVLVDIPLMRGVDYLDPSTPIYVEDLEAWEEFAGVTIGSGDALLVRTGRWARRDDLGPWAYGQGGAGLHASVLPWLRERDVAILVGDAVNDVQPSDVEGINRPIHQLTQVNLGLPLVDNGYLQAVAEAAERHQRWEFMVSIQINQIEGGTASPFNANATF